MTTLSLTGVWQGFFAYAAPGHRTEFAATLITSGAWLGGSTHEICETGKDKGALLCALLEGDVNGSYVHFVKSYDGTCGWHHNVRYDGQLNADHTQISGNWHITAGLAGHFVMIRPKRTALETQRRQLATV